MEFESSDQTTYPAPTNNPSTPIPQQPAQPVQQPTPEPQPVQQPIPEPQPAYQPPAQPVQAPSGPVAIQSRNPIMWAILSLIIPFAILYWFYKTAEEIKSKGGQIPTILIMLVPLVGSLYFMFKYAKEFARCIKGSEEWIMTFLSFFIAPLGVYLVQTELNKLSPGKPQKPQQPSEPTAAPQEPVQPAQTQEAQVQF